MSLARAHVHQHRPREHRSNGTVPGPLDDPGSLSGSGFAYLTPESAQRHSVVWAAATLRSNLMSIFPPKVYRASATNPEAQPEPVTLPPVFQQPNPNLDFDELAWAVEWSLLMRGNAFLVVTQRDRLQFPTMVEVLHPDYVWTFTDKDGFTAYRASGKVLNPADVLHLRRYRAPGALEGMSPLSYARKAILLGLQAEDFGARFFSDGGHPTALIKVAKSISDTAADTIKKRFLASLNGRREPVVLGGDMSYEQIQISPEDSQFLQTIQANDSTVARFMGVPGGLVDANPPAGGSITYANRETRALDFLVFHMQAPITRWERFLTAMTPRGQFVRVDTEVLLRTDALTLSNVNKNRLANGEVVPDELRAAAGRGPLPDGLGLISAWPPKAPVVTVTPPTADAPVA